MRVDTPVGLQLLFETGPLSCRCFVTELFGESDKVGADGILLHGCPQSRMSNTVEGLLEVYEDMVEVWLVLEICLRTTFLVPVSYTHLRAHET